MVERQQQFEGQGLSCINKSLHETMHALILSGNMKAVEQLRKEFNVPERRYGYYYSSKHPKPLAPISPM